MKRFALLLIAIILILTRTGNSQVPVTKTLAWDAVINADDYLVTLDGNTIGGTTGLTMPFTITTVGSHTFTVVARNIWGSGLPASLTVNVVSPGKSGNLRIQ